MKRFLSAVLFFTVLSSVLIAGEFSFVGKTDKDPLSYKPGEPMVFTVQLLEDGKPVDGKKINWVCESDDGTVKNGEAVSSAKEPLKITGSISKPGFVHVYARTPEVKQWGDKFMFNGSAGVLLDQIKGSPEPADFDEFWTAQKKRLAAVPLKVEMMKEVSSPNKDVQVFDVRISCLGMPISGYFCKPKNATAKSLPAHVTYHGYGVGSSNKHVNPKCLTLDVNAHDIENGQPKSYYEDLKKGALNRYGLIKKENEDRENCFWNGMLLRVIRSLEFMKSLPEWDGKNLIVSGGSQGGFQSLCAAGLDSDVTECYPNVPWMCDIGGPNKDGRLKSHFRPEWTPALDYYDSAIHAKRIKAKVVISAGLGDYVCPPSGQMVLYNNIKSEKKLEFVQGRTHGYFMKNGDKFVLESK